MLDKVLRWFFNYGNRWDLAPAQNIFIWMLIMLPIIILFDVVLALNFLYGMLILQATILIALCISHWRYK